MITILKHDIISFLELQNNNEIYNKGACYLIKQLRPEVFAERYKKMSLSNNVSPCNSISKMIDKDPCAECEMNLPKVMNK